MLWLYFLVCCLVIRNFAASYVNGTVPEEVVTAVSQSGRVIISFFLNKNTLQMTHL
jgi:hypothetical protein